MGRMRRRVDRRKLRDHNAHQISKWFEYRDPTIFKGTAGSYFSLEADRRSESRVPLSERGHKSLDADDNAHFRRHVLPILYRIADKEIFKPAFLLEYDPTALRRWRAGETENDKKQMEKFNRLCKFVATQLDIVWPGLRVFFVINPEDEEVNTPREAHDKRRSYRKEHAYRLIGAEIERVITEEGCGIEAAKGLVSQRDNKELGTPCSIPRVHAAWLFYRKEKHVRRSA
jgi:hypothetical protein